MTYRLNTDRLVCFSVLLWVLLPPGVFAWEGNPPGPDNVRWLEQFCSSYMQFLTLGGVLCAVIGFVCAALVWLVHRLDWARSLKISVLFVMSILLYSQAATVRALVPLGIALGISPYMLIAMFPAVNGYFFIPNYPTVVAAINFDRTGTTRIGKYILNHSFMMPGIVSTVVAIALGLLFIQIF